MRVERPRPRGLLRGLCWDYQTRHGLPGYYTVPAVTAAVLVFDTAIYSWTEAHPAILLIILVVILAHGAGLMAWWINSGYTRGTRRLIKIRCGHCDYTGFTTAQSIAERGMRNHLAGTHGIEVTEGEIGRYIVDYIDEHHREGGSAT